ncbi:hypothetical protein [Thiomicrorhabdus indica]|uniref:hypothetical protein n=1 Tax=Thiomicrorhabdus indica TaxID=2267253 RepID=UPI00102DF3D7|nr:hypothetical protein [Thiomicrorhabdus indica]
MPIIDINSWQLQPQENGVALLELQLVQKHSEQFAIHGRYSLQLNQPTQQPAEPRSIDLALFQITSNHSLQFLVFEHQLSALQNQTNLTANLHYDSPEKGHLAFDSEQNQLLIGIDSQTLPAGSPVFALAKQLRNQPRKNSSNAQLALLSSVNGFGFRIKPARFMVDLDAPEAIGACGLLEDWKIPNRLAVTNGLVGAMEGDIVALTSSWVKTFFAHHTSSSPWQVWVFYGNKKGQQWLTFDGLQTREEFDKLLETLEQCS